MRFLVLALLVPMMLAPSGAAFQPPSEEPFGTRLPNGRLQRDVIREDDYKKNLEDLGQMIQFAQEVKSDLEKNKGLVLNIESLKKLKEIEELSKQVQKRMKRR